MSRMVRDMSRMVRDMSREAHNMLAVTHCMSGMSQNWWSAIADMFATDSNTAGCT